MSKKFKWLIEVEVDETWVEDGFDFSKQRCEQIAERLIPWAYDKEVSVRVVSAPDPLEIRKVQGYDVAEAAETEQGEACCEN